MKNDFLEDFVSDKVDPLTPTHVDFNFDEVARNLGEVAENFSDSEVERLAEALDKILRIIVCRTGRISADDCRRFGQRAVAIMWVIHPDVFGGISQKALADMLNCRPADLSNAASEITRRWGIRNGSQIHGWNLKKISEVKNAGQPASRPTGSASQFTGHVATKPKGGRDVC